MDKPKKLIEVAMPVKEISAESVRDKTIRHGHISTLHLWWARRPLPVCRAVVFASLVPDPLDNNCPQSFRDAVEFLLGKKENGIDYYKPYSDIPHTSAVDPMEDNLRNRLLMFIGKFSDEYVSNEKKGKTTPAKNMLSDSSLIKWDNKNNENILNIARKLIWVSYNSYNEKSASDSLSEFDKHYNSLKKAENELYSIFDRHIMSDIVIEKQKKLDLEIDKFYNKMPSVFDPFAGGGAIPLEASRLGCRCFANDINPVAHIIEKCSLELPQKFGKSINLSKNEFVNTYGINAWDAYPQQNMIIENGSPTAVKIANRLSFDVNYHARKILLEVENEIGHLFPIENDKKTVAYYWVRTAICSNPSCNTEVPLLKNFYLVNTENKKIYLKPIIKGNEIDFEIKNGKNVDSGWLNRANLTCPICGNVTPATQLKQQFINRKTKNRIIVKIIEGKSGKEYVKPTIDDINILKNIPNDISRPVEMLELGNKRNFNTPGWGFKTFGDLFSDRSICFMNKLVEVYNKYHNSASDDYSRAIATVLAIWIDRIASRMTSFGILNVKRETIEHPFGRQAIPMVFDYPEINPFSKSGGGALNQLEWILTYINTEGISPFYTVCINASSGEKSQFKQKELTAVVTDPPYYDAIAYGDLSDFFYVWLKRTLSHSYPSNFSVPKTPKSEECTALAHHHDNNSILARTHFENKLLQIFESLEFQTSDIVAIMFAHQTTEAWSTLCNSILNANMNITGSWSTDTELIRALKKEMSSLSSSVTVACRPSVVNGVGFFRDIKKSIEENITNTVDELYKLGFRGPDLLTACFGKAVSEFGKYEKVEKADGSIVTVKELLEITKELAFNALLKGFSGDDFTKFYIGWLQLFGFTESDFDDAAKFARVGLSVNVSELFNENILVQNGNTQTLATCKERIASDRNLGLRKDDNIIDVTHRLMSLSGGSRNAILSYMKNKSISDDSVVWRVLNSLKELLPKDIDDYKMADNLLSNRESLIRNSKQIAVSETQQEKIF